MATAISLSLGITGMISAPYGASLMHAAGPVSLMTAPDPTNRPAPMTIIVGCRWEKPARSSSGSPP